MSDTDIYSEKVGVLARLDFEWSWAKIEEETRRRFAGRLLEVLGDDDPGSRWDGLTLATRRELAWSLNRTPEQRRAVWEEDAQRVRAAACAETMAFWERIADSAPEGRPQDQDDDSWGSPVPPTDPGGSAW